MNVKGKRSPWVGPFFGGACESPRPGTGGRLADSHDLRCDLRDVAPGAFAGDVSTGGRGLPRGLRRLSAGVDEGEGEGCRPGRDADKAADNPTGGSLTVHRTV